MPINPEFDFAVADHASYREELMQDLTTIRGRNEGPFDETDQAAWDATVAEIEKLDQDTANRAQLEALANSGSTEQVSYEVPRVNVNLAGTRDIFDESSMRGLNVERYASEAFGRAEYAIENTKDQALTDEVRSRVIDMIRDDPAQFDGQGKREAMPGMKAMHMLRTGSPDYVREFREWTRNPMGGPSRLLSATRTAMSEASSGVGGAILPYFLDPTIIETNNGVVSPIRDLSTVKQITTNIWHGVTSQGVTAEWVGEATEVSDASPSLTAPAITVYRADAYIQASMELIADSALSGEIAGLIGDAKARLEGTTFATGTGTNQPRGIITACSGGANLIQGSSGAANSQDLAPADIYAVANALPARYRRGYGNVPSWLASFTVINKIRALNTGTTAYQSTFWTDFNGPTPPKLIGFDIYEVSDMDSTIVSGSADEVLFFGDVSQYYIIDRLGMELAFNPLVLGSNRRPTGESAWVAFWRTGADMVNSGAGRILNL